DCMRWIAEDYGAPAHLPRAGDPREIGPVIAFVGSRANSYMTAPTSTSTAAPTSPEPPGLGLHSNRRASCGRRRCSPLWPVMDTPSSHLIDGELVAGRRHFDVINPATGEPFARCPDATRDDVDRAMSAATRAFATGWSRDEALRRRTLAHMSEALAAQAD